MVLFRRFVFIVLVGGFAVFFAGGVAQASPGESGVRESFYEVFSHGMKVGQVKTECGPIVRDHDTAFRFVSSTSINVNFLLYSYRLEKREEALVGNRGTYNYRRVMHENGKIIQVAGKMENGAFRFVIDEAGATRTLVIPRGSYDYTSFDCPEISMGPDAKDKVLRVLDLENMVVVTRKYHWVKDEDVDLVGRRIHCKVIDFEDLNKKGRRWIEGDDLGVLVLRQDGTGKGVSYSSKLASLIIRSGPEGR